MIFLSHNHADKPVVEPVALKLREIFGQEEVFYDSWSIRPGDGIIDKMNDGLSAPDYVFFFVTETSLASEMVKLEWQNALYAATKAKTKLVPVRVDGSPMPAILMQNLYIDMHMIGLEAAVAQIVSVAQGLSTFTPQHTSFENLSAEVSVASDGRILITVAAALLLEAAPVFIVALANEETDVLRLSIPGAAGVLSGFFGEVPADPGPVRGWTVAPWNGAPLRPKLPITVEVTPEVGRNLQFVGILHQIGQDEWKIIPHKWANQLSVPMHKPL